MVEVADGFTGCSHRVSGEVTSPKHIHKKGRVMVLTLHGNYCYAQMLQPLAVNSGIQHRKELLIVMVSMPRRVVAGHGPTYQLFCQSNHYGHLLSIPAGGFPKNQRLSGTCFCTLLGFGTSAWKRPSAALMARRPTQRHPFWLLLWRPPLFAGLTHSRAPRPSAPGAVAQNEDLRALQRDPEQTAVFLMAPTSVSRIVGRFMPRSSKPP